MKKIALSLACLAFFSTSYAQEIIKDKKLEKIEKTKQKESLEANLLQNSWINPLSINADISKSKSLDNTKGNSKKAYLSFNQDIFRSGGIFYTIQKGKLQDKLADVNFSSTMSLEKNEAYRLVLNLQKSDFEIQKQNYLLENKKIEISKKQEEYLNGTIDIEELDQAVIEKNDILNQIEDLKTSKQNLIRDLKKISSISYKKIPIQKLELGKLEEFLDKNSTLIKQELNNKITKKDLDITNSNYLPKISLYGELGYEDNSISNLDDDYYNYGVKFSIPIDFNMTKNKEVSRLNYLLSKVEHNLQKDEQEQFFKTTLENLASIDNKIINSNSSIKSYEEIYKLTSDLVEGFIKTKEDLKTIENRLSSSKLDIKILNLDKQILIYEIQKSLI